MADSTQAATGIPALEQQTNGPASHETAAVNHSAYGNLSRTLPNPASYALRDAALIHDQPLNSHTAAPTAHAAITTTHTAETYPLWLLTLPLSSPTNPRLPANTPAAPARNDSLQSHQHPDELPPILSAAQTAPSLRAPPTLPPIRPLIDGLPALAPQRLLPGDRPSDSTAASPALSPNKSEALASLRTLPGGHRREIPETWVASREVSEGHRRARMEALEFEWELLDLDYRLLANGRGV